jgi:hypothetical protein
VVSTPHASRALPPAASLLQHPVLAHACTPQAFCWLCGAATGSAHTWTKIEGHSCGRWKDELDKKIDEAARNHKRYMHYFERFKSHKDSFARESAKR